jgi:hypothetical protein
MEDSKVIKSRKRLKKLRSKHSNMYDNPNATRIDFMRIITLIEEEEKKLDNFLAKTFKRSKIN